MKCHTCDTSLLLRGTISKTVRLGYRTGAEILNSVKTEGVAVVLFHWKCKVKTASDESCTKEIKRYITRIIMTKKIYVYKSGYSQPKYQIKSHCETLTSNVSSLILWFLVHYSGRLIYCQKLNNYKPKIQ